MKNALTLTDELGDLIDRLKLVHRLLPKALENLGDAMNGYPTSTPGASPSSTPAPEPERDRDGELVLDENGNIPSPIRLTAVEALASQRDPAAAARRRIVQLIEHPKFVAHVNDLASKAILWGYTAAVPKGARGSSGKWCRSCLRIDKCSDRHRGDLCRWCYDFHAVEKHQPSIDLLDKHHRGIRIYSKDIKASRVNAGPGKRSRRKAAA